MLLKETLLIVLFICFFAMSSSSQNLTGTWEGGGQSQKHRLVVIQKGDTLIGYIYEKSIGYCTADFKGMFYPSQKRVTGEGVRFINKSLLHSLSVYSWRYSVMDSKEFLIGTLQVKGLLGGAKVAMQMSRISESVDTTAYMAKFLNQLPENAIVTQPMALPKDTVTNQIKTISPSVINDSTAIKKSKERITNTAKQISVDRGVVKFTLYDNGTYDGDTVSVIHNAQLIIFKKEVSLSPVQFSIQVNREQPVHEIIMVAENEGSIPPNTALLIIETNGKRYQLNLNASLRTNEKVVITLKE